MMGQNLTGKDLETEIRAYHRFAFGQNLLDVAVALVLATAFQKVVTSVIDHLIMPAMNYLVNQTGTSWRQFVFSPLPGMDLEVGHFLGSLLDFTIISLTAFVVYRKLLRRELPEPTKPQQSGPK